MRQESRKTRSVERDLPSNSKKLQVAQKKNKKKNTLLKTVKLRLGADSCPSSPCIQKPARLCC